MEYASFWEHLDQLRGSLIKVFLAIAIGTLLAFIYHQELIAYLTTPLETAFKKRPYVQEIRRERVYNHTSSELSYLLPKNSKLMGSDQFSSVVIAPKQFIEIERMVSPNQLAIFSPIEGFMASMKISLFAGILISLPYWLFILVNYIQPALTLTENQLVTYFIPLGSVFGLLGLLSAYYFTIPLANEYLLSFGDSLGVNLWSLSNYLDYSLSLILANVLAFQLATLLILLVSYDYISGEMLANNRRQVIVGAFILGAILTPPDVLSQIALAVPLILLYELIVAYAKTKPILRRCG